VEAIDNANLEAVIRSFPGKTDYSKNGTGFLITLKEDAGSTDLNNYCFKKGITLKKLFTHRNSLEQEFLKILKEND
jgi:hypothetical protein